LWQPLVKINKKENFFEERGEKNTSHENITEKKYRDKRKNTYY